MAKLLRITFIRFFIVGVTAFIVDAGLLYLLLYVLNFNPIWFGLISIANVISVICGLVTSYMLNRIWSFEAREERIASQGMRFVAVFISIYIGNQILFGLLTVQLTMQPLVAKVVVTFVQMFVSYFLYRKVVFK